MASRAGNDSTAQNVPVLSIHWSALSTSILTWIQQPDFCLLLWELNRLFYQKTKKAFWYKFWTFLSVSSSLVSPLPSSINKQNNMQRTWPTQTAIYSTFPNTLCQKNRQTLKTVIDAFNFVYYSFFSFHEASRNICGWLLIKLHSHSAYISLIHQTNRKTQSMAFQHLYHLYIQHQLKIFFLLLVEHWQAVEISYIRKMGFIIQETTS